MTRGESGLLSSVDRLWGAPADDHRERLGSEQPELPMGTASHQIPDLEFGFADVFGPLIACGLVLASFLYSKNVLEVKRLMTINK